jgi:hypothetical protein
MVTKPGPLCKVKLLNNQGDKLVVRSPEKAGVGGSTPSLATIIPKNLAEIWRQETGKITHGSITHVYWMSC